MRNTEATNDDQRQAATSPGQLSAGQAAVLHLIPGAATLVVYIVLAAVLVPRGWPNVVALGLAILLGEVPVCWMLMIRHVRRETGGRFSLAAALPWRAAVPWWQYLVIGLPVVLFSLAMIGGIGPRIEAPLLNGPFAGLPEWFVMRPDPSLFASTSRDVLLAMWGLTLVAMVLVGGPTQELFSRGFVLPRTVHLGVWAPAWNALVFAVYHLIAPWSWPGFLLMVLPWAYLVWWRRSVKIGLFIHIGMLMLQWLGMTALFFGLVPAPG